MRRRVARSFLFRICSLLGVIGCTLPAANALQLTVAWDSVAGASGYKVERSSNNLLFTEVASVTSSATSYTDSNLPSGSYWYRVRAFNNSTQSDYSNVASYASTDVAPAITQQPSSQTAKVGGSVTFNVTATGSPAPSYQWNKDGVILSGATSAKLSFPSVTDADAASYTVVVTNDAGSVTSSAATLTVTQPVPAAVAPTITTQPISQNVDAGSDVTFSVVVSGSPVPTYQWHKDGAAIGGATANSLSLSDVSSANAGTYTVVATNTAGSVTSNGAVLTVTTPTVSVPVTSSPSPTTATDSGTTPGGSSSSSTSTTTATTNSSSPPTTSSNDSTAGSSGSGSPNISTTTSSDNPTTTPTDSGNSGGSSPSTSTTTDTTNSSSNPTTSSNDSTAGSSGSGSSNTSTTTSSDNPTTTPTGSSNSGSSSPSTSTTTDTTNSSSTPTTPSSDSSAGNNGSSSSTTPTTTTTPTSSTTTTPDSSSSTSTSSATPTSPTTTTTTTASSPGSGSTNTQTSSNPSTSSTTAGAPAPSSDATTPAKSVSTNSNTTKEPSAPTQPSEPVSTPGSRLANASIRATGGLGDQVLIVGFVIDQAKSVLLRAVGPGLAPYTTATTFADPKLTVFDGSTPIATNDNWGGTAALKAAFKKTGAQTLDDTSKDAALVTTLGAKPYTMLVNGTGAGMTLAEVYDMDASGNGHIVNIAARAPVSGGDGVLIAGFVITGDAPKQVLVRGIGPSLAALGVSGVQARPQIDLFRGTTRIDHNEGWGGGSALKAAFAKTGAFELTDPNSKDAALLVTLEPGTYSVVVSSANNTTGIALVEVYDVP